MTRITSKTKAQRGAEAEVEDFRKSLGPFVVAAETTRMPMAFTDAKAPGHPFIFANDSFLSLTGYAREEILGKTFDVLMVDDADPATLAEVEAAFEIERDECLELCCRRKDGSRFWSAVFLSPVRDQAGEIVQHFASFADFSRHHQAEEHLRFLLDELSHRTQNTLATVQAIAAQTLRGTTDEAALRVFEARILALSRVHMLLGRERWLGVNLRELIDQVLLPFGRATGDARFSVQGDPVSLTPKATLALAMVFQELATNAAKYGALATPGGKVGLSWTIEPGHPDAWIRIRWQESGGPPLAAPGRKGFGTRLLEGGLAHELGGEVHLDFDPEGLICRIGLPIPRPRGQ